MWNSIELFGILLFPNPAKVIQHQSKTIFFIDNIVGLASHSLLFFCAAKYEEVAIPTWTLLFGLVQVYCASSKTLSNLGYIPIKKCNFSVAHSQELNSYLPSRYIPTQQVGKSIFISNHSLSVVRPTHVRWLFGNY